MQITKAESKKNLGLIFFGTITSLIGDELGSVAVSIWVALQTGNPINFAIVYSVGKFSRIIFSFFSGSVVDSFNKKLILYLSDFIQCFLNFCVLGVIVLNLNFNIKVVLFCIINFLSGICLSFFKPASRSILPEIVHEENLNKANVYLEVSKTFISMLSIIFAAGLVMFLGCEICIFINAVTFFISGLSEMLITYSFKIPEKKSGKNSKITKIAEGYKYVLSERRLFKLALIAAGLNFFSTPIFSNVLTYQYKDLFLKGCFNSLRFFGYILQDEKTFLTGFSSVTFFALGLGNIVGSFFSQKNIKLNITGLVIFCNIVTSLIFGLYFFMLIMFEVLCNIFILALVAGFSSFLSGFAMGLFNVYVTTLYQKHVNPEFLGRFFAFNTVLIQISSPMGMLLCSAFISLTGIFYPVFLISAFFSCFLLWFSRGF